MTWDADFFGDVYERQLKKRMDALSRGARERLRNFRRHDEEPPHAHRSAAV